jgi:nucleoid DNA-binding protein
MPQKPKALTKSAIYQEVAGSTGLAKKDVGSILDALTDLIKRQLGKKGPGIFTVPGLLKLRRVETKKKEARQGKNPLTGETIMIPAKPAGVTVRARVLKALKETVK